MLRSRLAGQAARRLAPIAVAAAALAVAGCGTPPPACVGGSVTPAAPSASESPIAQTSPAVAGLAQQYEPTVAMSSLDGFWPASVNAVLGEVGDGGARTTLVSRGRVVADPPTLANLLPSDAGSSYLDYPAPLTDKRAQIGAFLRGLGVPESTIAAWPANLSALARKTGRIYFFDGGMHCTYAGHTGYRALQYWFFYGLNFYPMTVDTATMLAHPLHADDANMDWHEGDWEHVAVLLEPVGSGYVPRYVWMARHSTEGKLIPWNDMQLDSAGHPIVYPAFGGHPSYPSCGAHPRALLAAAVYDFVVCGPGLYTLPGASTPLVDLAKASWSCWPGHFGTTVGTSAASNADDPTGQILVAGPTSPLRQAENKGVCPPP